MIERLQRALEHIEDVPEEIQEELAETIEEYVPRSAPGGARVRSFAGIWSDLPDDMEETLLRWRREVAPTPPMDEQLRWTEEE
jgi:hypothetical protein